MSEKCLKEATFNPKVKMYWTLTWVFISAITLVGILAIPVVAIIAWLMSDKILKALSARLLERKLVVKRGVWFVVEKSIPLEKITDVALSQGPFMRIFGLYQLSFETAGQSGAGALVALTGVNDASAFREAILAQKDNLVIDSKENETSTATANIETTSNSELSELVQSVQNIEKTLTKLLADKK